MGLKQCPGLCLRWHRRAPYGAPVQPLPGGPCGPLQVRVWLRRGVVPVGRCRPLRCLECLAWARDRVPGRWRPVGRSPWRLRGSRIEYRVSVQHRSQRPGRTDGHGAWGTEACRSGSHSAAWSLFPPGSAMSMLPVPCCPMAGADNLIIQPRVLKPPRRRRDPRTGQSIPTEPVRKFAPVSLRWPCPSRMILCVWPSGNTEGGRLQGVQGTAGARPSCLPCQASTRSCIRSETLVSCSGAGARSRAYRMGQALLRAGDGLRYRSFSLRNRSLNVCLQATGQAGCRGSFRLPQPKQSQGSLPPPGEPLPAIAFRLPPASPAFDALATEYGEGKRGVTESLRYRGEDPGFPLENRNSHRHLWKMASALLLHCNPGGIAGRAMSVPGTLTRFRNTIH